MRFFRGVAAGVEGVEAIPVVNMSEVTQKKSRKTDYNQYMLLHDDWSALGGSRSQTAQASRCQHHTNHPKNFQICARILQRV